ncbi:hypothetical protein ACP70R_016197 [Stipagrostis hirtigluma subsp. patula]
MGIVAFAAVVATLLLLPLTPFAAASTGPGSSCTRSCGNIGIHTLSAWSPAASLLPRRRLQPHLQASTSSPAEALPRRRHRADSRDLHCQRHGALQQQPCGLLR